MIWRSALCLLLVCGLCAAAWPAWAGGPRDARRVFFNERWCYSLEHPLDWTVRVDVTNEGKPERVVRERLVFRDPRGVPFFVSVWENTQGKSLDEWLSGHLLPSWREMDVLAGALDEVVAGVPARVFQVPRTGQAYGEWNAVFAAGGRVFEICYLEVDEGESLEAFYALLRSFAVHDCGAAP
jgi:hypothetical protein